MMAVCPVCGKNTAIHWPEFWVYRRGERFLCSENCMIVFDTREFKEKTGWIDDYYRRKKEMRKKISLDQKKKAVEIALGGGNPLKYLEECGSANPSAAWFYIKKVLKEKDPETWAKLKEPEEPKETLAISSEELANVFFGETVPANVPEKEEVTVTMEGKEIGKVPAEVIEKAMESAPKIGRAPETVRSAVETVEKIRANMYSVAPPPKPVTEVSFEDLAYGYKATAIKKDGIGEFYFDRQHGTVDWRNDYGEEISLTPVDWAVLANEIPNMLKVLGA